LTKVSTGAIIIHEGSDPVMRYRFKGKIINPMNLVYLVPENSPFLNDDVRLFARCEADPITRLYAFVSGATTCIPVILRRFAKTIKIPTHRGSVTMFAVPAEAAFSLSGKTRYVVLSKSDGALDALCLQAFGKLAGFFYLAQFPDGIYAQLAGEVCNRNFPEQPPISFSREVIAVLEPFYKLAQFIKPSELAERHFEFELLVERAEKFMRSFKPRWSDFSYRAVLSLASFLKSVSTNSGFKEVVLHGAEKVFQREGRDCFEDDSGDDGSVAVFLDVAARRTEKFYPESDWRNFSFAHEAPN